MAMIEKYKHLEELYPSVPKMPTPRETQELLMQMTFDILEKNPNQKRFVVCAPTGSGKSQYGVWIIKAIAKWLYAREMEAWEAGPNKDPDKKPRRARGVYTSPLNVLVDQLQENLEGKSLIATLKGREHYSCKAGRLNCAKGYCKLNKCSQNIFPTRYYMKEEEIDLYKEEIVEGNDGKPIPVKTFIGKDTHRIKTSYCKEKCVVRSDCPCSDCEYIQAMTAFTQASIGNTNFTLFEVMKGASARIIVVDEMDDTENFIRMTHSITIPQVIKFGEIVDQSPYFAHHIERLRDIKMEYDCDIELSDEGRVKLPDAEYLRTKRDIEKIELLLADYDTHRKNWCVTYNEEAGTTKYEPITVSRFLDSIFHKDAYIIMMSATPIKHEGYAYIEVPSTFPAANRPWKYLPLGKMGVKHREDSSSKIAQFLIGLRGKTLVHCHAYSIARLIHTKIKAIDPHRTVLLQHSGKLNLAGTHNSYGRDTIVEQFKSSKDPDAILLSVNLARGVDFPEPEIINNVIAKIPWMDYRDLLVQAKNYECKGKGWQDEEIARCLMQAYGRLPRSPEKYSRCIIVDSDFNDPDGHAMLKNWYKKNKRHFYTWFTEAEVERFLK